MNQRLVIIGIVMILAFILVYFFSFYGTEEHLDQNQLGYCGKIITPAMKKTCIAMLEKNFSVCMNVPYFDKYCYDSVSILMQNPSECEGLAEYPRSACYHNIAKLRKDQSLCEKVSWFDLCYWDIAELINDPSLCHKMEAGCEKKQCLAMVTGNISYCEEVPEPSEKELCLLKLSENKDVSKCEYVPEYGETTYISSCVYDIAKKTGDISVCSIITSDEFKWKCLAELVGSEIVCDKAETQFWKDFCLVEVLKNKLTQE